MTGRWYRNAVIYSVDVGRFQDSDGDGIGDLPGLMSRLDYLARLGVTALWLNPVHPSPGRDGGYDVTDYYGINPQIGSLGDMAALIDEADERGLRIILDLVVNHTSDEHPWFQAARSDRRSPYRDWYVWSDDEPPDRFEGQVFPGVEAETWTYDEHAGAWYRHRFYGFEPDLNTDNPAVRAEIQKITGFWLRLGVSGFRIDAAPFLIERRPRHGRAPDGRAPAHDFSLLRRLQESVSWRRGDAILLAEANVPDDEIVEYFGTADGSASRIDVVFAFRLNEALMLSLARQDATSLRATLEELPALPRNGQWATFLRNHDEVDLGWLTATERDEVFDAFGPEADMQAYGRGLRRRMAPMLDGDGRRLRMAYSLQFTMPGTPVIRYGDEIGMGEDLSLPEREAIRTPMQWDAIPGAGFSSADSGAWPIAAIREGRFAYDKLNVAAQRRDPESLLTWFERTLHTLRECPEVGNGRHELHDGAPSHVLVHTATGPSGQMLFLHNLADTACTVAFEPGAALDPEIRLHPFDVLTDADYGDELDLRALRLGGYGFRWIRLHRATTRRMEPEVD